MEVWQKPETGLNAQILCVEGIINVPEILPDLQLSVGEVFAESIIQTDASSA